MIPIYTNRALARLRNGNPKGCIEDSTAALEIICDDPRPGESITIGDNEMEVVKLDEGFVKALRRRAEGYEAVEKWELARSDWERLAGISWVPGNQRGEASKGIGRCRKMLSPPEPTSTHPKPKTRPKPKISPTAELESLNAQPSESLSRLRSSNASQESEETQKAALKDLVDLKLSTWSAGKETNIRVLLANLDTILWSELNWKKVGMGELVGEGQVKSVYTKAIGRVHPDKVGSFLLSIIDG